MKRNDRPFRFLIALLTLVHTFTPAEAEAGGLPVLVTAQGYDPRGTLHTCTSGPILPPAGDW
ncbi:MAG: hypothetical protein IJH03_09250 [Clostridia bacterium]|nr:hypothetical protein [Clostridia bacterium]